MTRILLVRHGQTLWNHELRYQGHRDIPLSEEGRAQARRLSRRLAEEKIDAFYASDLSRAYETAQIIAAPHNQEVKQVRDLKETNFGKWEGMTHAEITKEYGELAQRWFNDPFNTTLPEGESMGDVKARSELALKQIVDAHPNQTVAVVAHGGILRLLLSGVLHMSPDGWWRIKQDNLALNIIEYYGDKAIVCLMNDTSHLKDKCTED